MSLDFMGFPSSMDLTDDERQENEESVARAVKKIEFDAWVKKGDAIPRYTCIHEFCDTVVLDHNGVDPIQRKARLCNECFAILHGERDAG